MSSHNGFSVSLISAGLALFYSTSLRTLPTRRRLLPAFIGSFLRAPRFIAPRLSRDQGFGYIAEADVDTTDSPAGFSPFVLLENGRPLTQPFRNLPGANKIDVQAVREQGEGRYIHIGRRIFFSPSDNGDPAGRKYLLLETLTLDSAKVKTLLALAQQRADQSNPVLGNAGAWLLAKLQVYAGDMLAIGETDASDATAVMLKDLRVDLTGYGLARLQAERATLRWTMHAAARWHRVTMDLRGLTGDGVPAGAWLTCVLGFTLENEIRLEAMECGQDETTWLRSRLDWSEDGLAAGEIACADVTPLRLALTEACGTADRQRSWIASFIGAIRSGELPLVGQLDETTAARLIEALSPDGAVTALTLRLTREGASVAISAGDAA